MPRCPHFLPSRLLLLLVAVVGMASGRRVAAAPPVAADTEAAHEESLAEPEELELETSDGVGLAAWYYAVPEDASPG